MKKIAFLYCLFLSINLHAQNWDLITSSKEYLYGVGQGKTQKEADRLALDNLVSKIAVHISSTTDVILEEIHRNGEIDAHTYVKNCVNTYSQTSLTNTECWVIGKEPDVTVRRWIKRSELDVIYADRIAKAKDMVGIAMEAEEKGKIDMALQYYYWAYALICSIQRPNSVTWNNHVLVTWIPMRMEEIMSDVKVSFQKQDENFVDLAFTYKGKPVASLEFTYSDGRSECTGSAKDGWGMIEIAPGHESDFYHLTMEYECKGLARGDAEMKSVLDVIPKRQLAHAEITVSTKTLAPIEVKPEHTEVPKQTADEETELSSTKEDSSVKVGITQMIENDKPYIEVYSKVLQAIENHNYSAANGCFTLEGLEVYNKLITYGTGRITGTPNPVFYKGCGGEVVARGLQMTFSFHEGRKKTFVEDVNFTFNKDAKITNVTFGLGKATTDAILHKPAGWKEETRELILEFMENYKTAFCLERLEYIRSIFHDNATIIIGNVAKVTNHAMTSDSRMASVGKDIITYNRYTKDEYIERLARTFNGNEFINIRFTDTDIQWLENSEGELFSIQIAQDYNSSKYADKGYLFLMVDMTNHDEPLIKIRTWQPDKDPQFGLYGPGHFYK